MRSRSLFTVGAATVCIFALIGGNLACSGGSGSPTPGAVQTENRGRIRIVIAWPARSDTRLIPAITEGIDIAVYGSDPNTPIALASVARQAGGTQSEEIFEGLPAGDVLIKVSAIPARNVVSMNALAIGSTTATVVAGETAEANIVMDSTINRLVVSPQLTSLYTTLTYPQSVRAEDGSGNVILTLPENIVRTSDNEAVVTVDANGVLTPRSAGTARISIRETESGVQTSYAVEVLPPDPGTLIPPVYEITDLGPAPPNLRHAEVLGVNDNAQVVGYFLGTANQQGAPGRAFVWENGTFRLLGLPEGQPDSIAYDINNKGQIVGGSRGMAWTWEGGTFSPINIPGIPANPFYVRAQAINESGEVVGEYTASDVIRYFRRSIEGEVTVRASFDFTSTTGIRRVDINEAGDAVYSTRSPLIWRRNGETISLLPENMRGGGSAITDDGAVVGFSEFPGEGGSVFQPSLWMPGGTATRLLPPEFASASDVTNGKLIIVNRAAAPCIVKAGQPLVDLTSRLPPGTGWALGKANAINQKGQIVGTGLKNGQFRGYLMTPKF